MPIFDQGYQHWQGRLGGSGLRWWPITWRGVRTLFRSRWTRVALIFAISPCVALAAVLIFWGLVENKVAFIQPLLAMMSGLPEELRQKPEAYRVMVWTLAFQFFYNMQIFFMMILVAIVGPDLISKDLRFNAMPLYFSRPIRRFDYFLGKLGVIGFVVAMVTVLPAVLAYLLGVGFSLDIKIVSETVHLLFGSILSGLVMVASAGGLMLALSSLTRNSRYVAAMWIGLWIVSETVAGILIGALPDQNWPPICSYTHNLKRVCERLLDTERAWTTIDKLVESFEKTRRAAMQSGGMMAPGGMRREIQTPKFGTTAEPEPIEQALEKARRAGLQASQDAMFTSATSEPGDKQVLVVGQLPAAGASTYRGGTVQLYTVEAGALKRAKARIDNTLRRRLRQDSGDEFASDFKWWRQAYPWTWSLGVIAGLFALSLLVLTTRVKSLDRLK